MVTATATAEDTTNSNKKKNRQTIEAASSEKITTAIYRAPPKVSLEPTTRSKVTITTQNVPQITTTTTTTKTNTESETAVSVLRTFAKSEQQDQKQSAVSARSELRSFSLLLQTVTAQQRLDCMFRSRCVHDETCHVHTAPSRTFAGG